MREEDNVMREEDNVAEVTNESTERPTKTARRKFLESAGAAAGALTASGLLIGPELVSGQKRNLPPRQLE